MFSIDRRVDPIIYDTKVFILSLKYLEYRIISEKPNHSNDQTQTSLIVHVKSRSGYDFLNNWNIHYNHV